MNLIYFIGEQLAIIMATASWEGEWVSSCPFFPPLSSSSSFLLSFATRQTRHRPVTASSDHRQMEFGTKLRGVDCQIAGAHGAKRKGRASIIKIPWTRTEGHDFRTWATSHRIFLWSSTVSIWHSASSVKVESRHDLCTQVLFGAGVPPDTVRTMYKDPPTENGMRAGTIYLKGRAEY